MTSCRWSNWTLLNTRIVLTTFTLSYHMTNIFTSFFLQKVKYNCSNSSVFAKGKHTEIKLHQLPLLTDWSYTTSLHLTQNITNVQNVLLFHLHRPEVSCAIHQQHRPQCFAISHSKCQSSAVSYRPCPELVSDTRDPTSCPIFDSQLDWDQGYWEVISPEELIFGASHCGSSIVWCARWAKPKATT